MDDPQAGGGRHAARRADRRTRPATGLGPAVWPVLIGIALLAFTGFVAPLPVNGPGRDIPRHLGFSRLELIVNLTGMLVACALPLAWGAWSCRREGLRLPGVAAIVMGLAVGCTFAGLHLAQARQSVRHARVFALSEAVNCENARRWAEFHSAFAPDEPVPAARTPAGISPILVLRSEASETTGFAWLAVATGSLLFGLLLPTGGARPAREARLTPPAGG